MRGNPRHLNRNTAFIVVAGDIGEACGKTPPAPRCFAFRANHPAAQFDGFLPRKGGGKHRICGIEQMMAFVKDDPCWPVAFVATARGIDHHQRVVGDHYVGGNAAARGAFDEAFFIMRAAGIDALTPPISQRGRSVAAKERG